MTEHEAKFTGSFAGEPAAPAQPVTSENRPLTVEERREAYLRNQQAVAATPIKREGWLPLTITAWVLGAAALVLFAIAVVGYFNDPQQTGPTTTTIPTLVAIALLAAAWCGLIHWMLVPATIGGKVRNIILAAVLTAIIVPFGGALFVFLASLVADLASAVVY